MIYTLACLFLLCLVGIQFGREKAFEEYLTKDRTNAIKGIFILIVFLSHIRPYLHNAGFEYNTIGDILFRRFMTYTSQLMVVMFLFYSGYGVMESIKKKKDDYIKTIPRHRVLNTLFNFDVAVCIFLIVNLFIGKKITLPQFMLSLIAWDSVGNSNWYIFAILICYLSTWMTASIIKDPQKMNIGNLLLLIIVSFALSLVKESYWYNTLWAYPAGMLFSTNLKRIESFIDLHYILSLFILLSLFSLIYAIPMDLAGLRMNFLSIVFALTVTTLSMRIRIYNPVLRWCGEKLFPLYIYQRIPMIVFAAILPSAILTD